jgi:lipid-binding SYLF domain-containing protein
LLVGGCATPKGVTVEDRRSYVLKMKDESLARLHKEKPETRGMVKKASGYAVFSNIGTHVFFLAGGNGFGVVIDNATGRRTFMKMRSVGFGLGMGVKDFRAVFIFKSKAVMKDFIDKGWEFGGQADAAAKSGEKGGAAGGEAYLEDNIEIFQLTESGLALQATVSGTKYWPDKDLN